MIALLFAGALVSLVTFVALVPYGYGLAVGGAMLAGAVGILLTGGLVARSQSRLRSSRPAGTSDERSGGVAR